MQPVEGQVEQAVQSGIPCRIDILLSLKEEDSYGVQAIAQIASASSCFTGAA